jgi:hypothetical protein
MAGAPEGLSAALTGRYQFERGALELVEQGVDHNFYPHDFIARYSPFMAPLRGMPEFERILAKAARRVADFRL